MTLLAVILQCTLRFPRQMIGCAVIYSEYTGCLLVTRGLCKGIRRMRMESPSLIELLRLS